MPSFKSKKKLIINLPMVPFSFLFRFQTNFSLENPSIFCSKLNPLPFLYTHLTSSFKLYSYFMNTDYRKFIESEKINFFVPI